MRTALHRTSSSGIEFTKRVLLIGLLAPAFAGCFQTSTDNDARDTDVHETDIRDDAPITQRTCATDEMDALLRQKYPGMGTMNDFEAWMAIKKHEVNTKAVSTIPVVFHIIHDGEAVGSGDNISDTYINAQLDQLNNDFRKITGTSGHNNHPDGADTEVQFSIAAINRIDRSTMGWSTPPYSSGYVDGTIKPNSIWDPDQYFNIWVADLSGGLLGWAQFPSQSGLPGFSNDEGPGSTDGVVVLTTSVGSTGTPFPGGGAYNKGRTLTHEVGHWLGLRHIWGDGGCSVDDFVSDTPTSDASNFGCPTGHSSCSSTDMIENYMDYTDDSCMNTFTSGQKTRIQTVLASALRRQFGPPQEVCDDGTDNDGDGDTDCADSECSGGPLCQADETGWCDDGLDNDNDGNTDCADADCAGAALCNADEVGFCNDDFDNDGDGTADCDDSECAADPVCQVTDVVVTINQDDYPSETSWDITDSGSNVVASGASTGTTVPLPDGDYTFTIYDSYGDGICCAYGNGSYSVSVGGTVVASGASFGSSESTPFTIGGGGGPSNEAPIANFTFTTDNLTADFTDSSSDNDGTITSWSWDFGDSNSSAAQSPSHTYSAAGTYSVTLTVTDDDGASHAISQNVEVTAPATGVDDFSDFESGTNGWADGGSDAARITNSYAPGGSSSYRIRDNTSTSVITKGFDMTGANSLTIDFDFQMVSMENNEDFWVQYNDGSGWQTIGAYARGAGYNNNAIYSESVTITRTNHNFSASSQVRFRCDASNNRDHVYIDNVQVTTN